MITLKILKGDPTAKNWADIGILLEGGSTTGIDQPPGINWTVEWKPSSNVNPPKETLRLEM